EVHNHMVPGTLSARPTLRAGGCCNLVTHSSPARTWSVATLGDMYEIVLTRRRVLAGVLVIALVVLLGSRFLLHGPSASTALDRPIVGAAEAGSARASP